MENIFTTTKTEKFKELELLLMTENMAILNSFMIMDLQRCSLISTKTSKTAFKSGTMRVDSLVMSIL